MTQALSPVRACLAVLRAAYPNAVINPETVDAYEAALGDLDPQDLGDAVAALVKESRYLPSIAEIRDVVAEHKLALPSPTEAWCEARERAFGTWDKPRHPLVHQVIQDMGGTYLIKTSANPSITQAQFLKAYKERRADLIQQFVRTARVPEMPELPTALRLLGRGEIVAATDADWTAIA